MVNKKKLEKKLEEKFYYGYDNREEVLEAMIYFANHELHQKKAKDKNYSLRQEYITSKEPFWKENVKRATQLYTQFYRFVDLNDILYDKNGRPYTKSEEIKRLIYTAISRCRNKVYLKIG